MVGEWWSLVTLNRGVWLQCVLNANGKPLVFSTAHRVRNALLKVQFMPGETLYHHFSSALHDRRRMDDGSHQVTGVCFYPRCRSKTKPHVIPLKRMVGKVNQCIPHARACYNVMFTLKASNNWCAKFKNFENIYCFNTLYQA